MNSLSGIYSALLLGVAYCLTYAQLTDACYSTSVNGPSQVYHFIRRQRDWHLDAANQRCRQRSHLIQDTVEPSAACPGYLPDHHVRRNYFHTITFT